MFPPFCLSSNMLNNSSNTDNAGPIIGANTHNNGTNVTSVDPFDELIYGNYRRFQDPSSPSLDPSTSYALSARRELYDINWVTKPKITRGAAPRIQYAIPRRVSCSWTEENESLGLIRPFDVICGRSRLAHSHFGNKNLRRLIKEYSPLYQGTSCRQEKKRITITIISLIHDQGGRFLAVDNCDEVASVTRVEIVSPEFRYMKVSHALRSHQKTSASSSKKVIKRETENVTCLPTPRLPPTTLSFSTPDDVRPVSTISFSMPDEDRPASVISWQDDEDFEAESDLPSVQGRQADDDVDCEGGDPLLAIPIKEVEEPIWDESELDMGEIDLQLLFRL